MEDQDKTAASIQPAVLAAMAKPFFDQGADEVVVVQCCKRLFVGVTPPARCSTCAATPTPLMVLRSMADVANLAEPGNSR